ncbi:paramyosin, short form-like [Leptidea sinapis]|uniref:paramyosin, short form-like n=1 Tax=Leptidea sinapis TaxID=189913 RepID=UPI0021C2DC4A|nr:paramyosin, short form-like [Leptidea sinapis]
MAPIKITEKKWNKPPTAIYENNYGYGINFYQPMIDYIDAKERGETVKPPHLPWNNERGLEKYRFNEPIKSYSEQDLKKMSREISAQAKKDRSYLSVGARSPFSVIATAAATNLTKHIETESVSIKSRKKKVEKDYLKSEKQNKMYKEVERELARLGANVELEAELKSNSKLYRGKSARAIAQTLLDQSRLSTNKGKVQMKNIHNDETIKYIDQNKTSKYGDDKTATDYKITSIKTINDSSPKICVVQIETEIPPINNDYIEKINELKETIKLFDKIDTTILINRRYNKI